jgi:pimeloyl-ACP methyl ester carboxylesterase
MNMSQVTATDGTRLHVNDWGSGRPVVLIHGWPLSADSWDPLAVPFVEAGYRTIAYDRRGFGRSDQPWDGYDYDTLADDLASVLEQTGAGDAILVGFSMGGGEVARYMSRHRGKGVGKVALVASVLPFRLKTDDNPDGTEAAVFEQGAQALRRDRAEFLTGFFEKFFGIGVLAHPVSDETVDHAWCVAMQASLRATLACQKAFSSTDFREDLESIDVPTLLIHGTEDKTVPIDASSRKAARLIPGSTLLEYEGAPHGLFASHREMLTRDLLAFFAK